MSSFIFILIILFTILLAYQTFLAYFSAKIIEGNTGYKDYDTSNPNNAMILAQQNAGNISALKSQFDDMNISNLKNVITDISANVYNLQTQVNGLAKAQQQQGEQLAGGSTPATISGTS